MQYLLNPVGERTRESFLSRLKNPRVLTTFIGLFLPMMLMISVALYYWNAREPMVIGPVRYLPTYDGLSSFCLSHACSVRPEIALSQTLLNALIVLGLSLMTTILAVARQSFRSDLKKTAKVMAFVVLMLSGTAMGLGTSRIGGYHAGPQTLQGAIWLLFIDCIVWLGAFSTLIKPATPEIRAVGPTQFRVR